MAREFSSIQSKVGVKEHNKFDLSYDVCETNDLCVERPIMCREVVPNDNFHVNLSSAFRFGSMVAPTFGRINTNYHAFFVPYRLIFKNFPHFWDGTLAGGFTGSRANAQAVTLPYITPVHIMHTFLASCALIPQELDVLETSIYTKSTSNINDALSAYRSWYADHTEEAKAFGLDALYPYPHKLMRKLLCYEVPCDEGYDFVFPELAIRNTFMNIIRYSESEVFDSFIDGDDSHVLHTESKNVVESQMFNLTSRVYSRATTTFGTSASSTSMRCFRFTSYGRQVMSMLRALGYDINVFSSIGAYVPSIETRQTAMRVTKRYYVSSSVVVHPNLVDGYANRHLSALPLLAWVRIYTDYLKNRKGSPMDEYQSLFETQKPNLDPWLLSNSEKLRQLTFVYYGSDYLTSSMKAPLDYDNLTTPSSEFSFYTRSFDVNKDQTYQNVLAFVNDNNSVGANGYYQGSDGKARPMQALDGNLLRAVQSAYSYALRNNLAGQRYADRLRARFGITPSSARLDMVELLGYSSQPIYINDVMSNATTLNQDGSINTDLGDYGGKCETTHNFGFSYKVPEFGVIICTYNITPKGRYPYGIDYSVLRENRSQFFNPEFDGLATRSISFGEMLPPFAQTAKQAVPLTSTFGYTPTYAEYKISRDRNNGDFCRISQHEDLEAFSFARVNSAMAIMQADRVGLEANNNESFLSATEDMEGYFNIFNDTSTDADHIFCYHGFNIDAYRPMCKLFDLQGITGGNDITIKPFGNNK